MTTAYIRFSTDKQDETQQLQSLREWAEPRGITIDAFEKDEGVSGGVSYKERNLYKLVRRMKAGDVLLCSEVSRLGRSMADLNKLVNDELAPRKVRLIVTKMGLDLNCADLKAMDQMILFSFGFAAQIEKELICSRTQSTLDDRKARLAKDGGFFSKSGRWCEKLGAKKGHNYGKIAGAAAGVAHTKKASAWRSTNKLYSDAEKMHLRGKTFNEILAWSQEAYEEQPDVYCTRYGHPLCKGTLSRWIKEWDAVI